MSKVDEKSLRTAAKELNEVFGLDPKINVKASAKELTDKITEAIKLIDPEDEFSEVTTEVIEALKGSAPAKGKKGKKVEEEEVAKELENLKKLHEKAKKPLKKENLAIMPFKDKISFEDFQKLDLRSALIVAAEKISKSKKCEKKFSCKII